MGDGDMGVVVKADGPNASDNSSGDAHKEFDAAMDDSHVIGDESSAPNSVISLNVVANQLLQKAEVKVYDIGHIIGANTTIRMTKAVLQEFARANGNPYKRTCTVVPIVEKTIVEIQKMSIEELVRKDETVEEPRRSRTGRIIKTKKIVSIKVKQNRTNVSDMKRSLRSNRLTAGDQDGSKSANANEILLSSESPTCSSQSSHSDGAAKSEKRRDLANSIGRNHFFADFDIDLPRTSRIKRNSAHMESSDVSEELSKVTRKNNVKRKSEYDDPPYEPKLSVIKKKRHNVIASDFKSTTLKEYDVPNEIDMISSLPSSIVQLKFNDKCEKVEEVPVTSKPIETTEETNVDTTTADRVDEKNDLTLSTSPPVNNFPNVTEVSGSIDVECVSTDDQSVALIEPTEDGLKLSTPCSKNLQVKNQISDKDLMIMKMNESSEIGLVEVEIGTEVPFIDPATGKPVLKKDKRISNFGIGLLVLADEANTSKSSEAHQTESSTTLDTEKNDIPQATPVVDTVYDSESDNMGGTKGIVSVDDSESQTQPDVGPLAQSPPIVRLPTPGTVKVAVTDIVRVTVPEEEVAEVVVDKRYPPFLLFNSGPPLVAGRVYISALEGHPMSLWRYNGLSFDPFGMPALAEIVHECTKENVAQPQDEFKDQ